MDAVQESGAIAKVLETTGVVFLPRSAKDPSYEYHELGSREIAPHYLKEKGIKESKSSKASTVRPTTLVKDLSPRMKLMADNAFSKGVKGAARDMKTWLSSKESIEALNNILAPLCVASPLECPSPRGRLALKSQASIFVLPALINYFQGKVFVLHLVRDVRDYLHERAMQQVPALDRLCLLLGITEGDWYSRVSRLWAKVNLEVSDYAHLFLTQRYVSMKFEDFFDPVTRESAISIMLERLGVGPEVNIAALSKVLDSHNDKFRSRVDWAEAAASQSHTVAINGVLKVLGNPMVAKAMTEFGYQLH
eukprot:jgi/Mesvir1/21748/Mv04155-RA.1